MSFVNKRDYTFDSINVKKTITVNNVVNTLHYLDIGGSLTGTISVQESYTEIDSGYVWNQPYKVYDLPNASLGAIKTIALKNTRSAPVKVRTSKGCFILGSEKLSVDLIFTQNGWKGDVVWFVDTQSGNPLIGTNNMGTSIQGISVAISSDEQTIAIGGPSDDGSIGAVWIFSLNTATGVWSQQGNKIVGNDYSGAALQGYSVSLSADGNTLAFGGYADGGGYIGAAWVWTRNATTKVWSQQGAKLVGTGGTPPANQGYSISLSADGNTLAVGGISDGGSIGATWVFTRSDTGVWSQQGGVLIGTVANLSLQGCSVSLSADGNTLAVGGRGDATNVGAVWIFIRDSFTSGVWSQQGAKLVASDGVASRQGTSVSLSADGNTLAVGGYGDGTNIGAAWIWNRINGVWTQQGNKLVGSGYSGSPRQGWSLSLSSDGNTLIVGGYLDASPAGAVWVWTRASATGAWSQQGSKLVNTTVGQQGYSIAFQARTLVVGAPITNNSVGAALVYN